MVLKDGQVIKTQLYLDFSICKSMHWGYRDSPTLYM